MNLARRWWQRIWCWIWSAIFYWYEQRYYQEQKLEGLGLEGDETSWTIQ